MKGKAKILSFRHQHYSVLVFRLIVILLILAISRMALYFFNADIFNEFSFPEIINAFFIGFRFDFSVLMMITSIMIIGNTIPFKLKFNKTFRITINSITLILVFLAISINFADAIYYRYTLKRMTFDIFSYVEKTDVFWDVAPQMMLDYWFTWVISLILLILLSILFIKLNWLYKITEYSLKKYLRDLFIFLFSVFIIIIGIRGGFQLKPINIVDAGKNVPSQLNPLVLNTPFTIIKSYGQTGLELKDYFNQQDLESIYNPVCSYQKNDSKEGLNVVIIILESFSSENIGYLSGKRSFTPFLDSLFDHSLVFKAIANGKRSIEGIPAILSGLPTLSDESFLNSPYAANGIEGIANTLNKYSYSTAFFHGGKNGTMSFDSYTVAAGFDKYFGMNEYPDTKDFDGHWGIWDEEFLQYFKTELSQMSQPFLGVVFTLSSHHPFQIPEKYDGKFTEGELPIQKCISYSDHALKLFFKEAEQEDWFENTLFVITSDHTSEGVSLAYQNSLGQFSIPIAFYSPSDSLFNTHEVQLPVQQTDIFPSIIDYLGIKDTIISFGSSIFEKNRNAFAVNYFNQKIQFLDSVYLLQMQGDNVLGLYEYQEDSLLKNNLMKERDIDELILFRNAFIQQYNNRMIENRVKFKKNE